MLPNKQQQKSGLVSGSGNGSPSSSSSSQSVTLEFTHGAGTRIFSAAKVDGMVISEPVRDGNAITGLAYQLGLHDGSGVVIYTAYASLALLNAAITSVDTGKMLYVKITATLTVSKADISFETA